MCNCLTGPHGIHANCSYVKTAYVDCGNKGGTIGHYYSHKIDCSLPAMTRKHCKRYEMDSED
jgi:hypothetical protein